MAWEETLIDKKESRARKDAAFFTQGDPLNGYGYVRPNPYANCGVPPAPAASPMVPVLIGSWALLAGHV
jgi:hypothetical protein